MGAIEIFPAYVLRIFRQFELTNEEVESLLTGLKQNRKGKKSIMGLKQKVARKKPQMYIQRNFDIDLPSLLIYLGFKHF